MTAADIAARIKEARQHLKYSYADLAKLTGLSKSTLQRYETGGIQDIPISKLLDIANALNIPSDTLIGLSPPVLITHGNDYNNVNAPQIPDGHLIEVSAKNNFTWSKPLIDAYAAADRLIQVATCNVLQIPYIKPHVDLNASSSATQPDSCQDDLVPMIIAARSDDDTPPITIMVPRNIQFPDETDEAEKKGL